MRESATVRRMLSGHAAYAVLEPAQASGVLGLALHVTEDGLRFHDPVTGST